ncbi:hypothetical protein TRFO_36604 [Tritrichomonas foetus]|uniref:Uncharacterized protein n=1 Tax=Tritrichomonas foetus TaxID=1144522 RepID=A0A1J4JHY5_9EUKA|nr:hypothetical protein TRFO_36604 [Tritrichomonas foetus]|eukprot:OHS97219.1 hypothetical protein TRFO_36604 [Tritrichomonas foetus]
MHCFFEPYLALIFLSSIFLTGSFIFSITQTNNIRPSKCSTIPNVTLSNDVDQLHKIIADSIKKAKRNVQLSFSDLNETALSKIYIPALLEAKSNGASIKIIVSLNNNIEDILKNNGITDIFDINTANLTISSQSIVADDTAFIAPFLIPNPHGSTPMLAQLISISDCESLVQDLSNFMSYYELSQLNKLPRVIPGNLMAQTSAIKPLQIEKSKFFMFHNPQSYVDPLRIDTSRVLTALFDENPVSIDFYSYSPQCLTSLVDPTSDEFSLYLIMKELLMKNQTKVRYLASKQSSQEETEPCYEALAAFSNVEFRVYNLNNEGPNFIIVHFEKSKESYIFAQYIRALEIGNSVALHLATNDEGIGNYLQWNFESVWDEATPVSIEWYD